MKNFDWELVVEILDIIAGILIGSYLLTALFLGTRQIIGWFYV